MGFDYPFSGAQSIDIPNEILIHSFAAVAMIDSKYQKHKDAFSYKYSIIDPEVWTTKLCCC